jgi:endonuclease III
MKSKKSKLKISFEDDEDINSLAHSINNITVTKNPKNKSSKINQLKKSKNEKEIDQKSRYPKNFEKQWEYLKAIRGTLDASVDTMGPEHCSEPEIPRNIYKFQTLISLLLSAQTKDPMTYAATQRLIEHGLDIDTILKTDEQTITNLIYGVSFHNNKTKYIKKVFQL